MKQIKSYDECEFKAIDHIIFRSVDTIIVLGMLLRCAMNKTKIDEL